MSAIAVVPSLHAVQTLPLRELRWTVGLDSRDACQPRKDIDFTPSNLADIHEETKIR